MPSIHAPVLGLLLLLTGCDFVGSAPLDATLAATAEADAVSLRVTNTGGASIEFASLPCGADLEVLHDGEWEPSPYAPLIACLGVQVRLGPGEREEASYPTAGVPAGTYRFRLLVRQRDGATASLTSNAVVR